MPKKYKLVLENHGMGGMHDAKTKVVAYFSTITKAKEYFEKHNIKVDYWKRSKDFDLGQALCFEERRRGLGSLTYTVYLHHDNLPIDPKDLIIN